MSRRRKPHCRWPATALVGLLLVGCGAPNPSPTGEPDPSTTPQAASADPAREPAGTLTIAVNGPLTTLSNAAADEPTITALPFLFNGLYRHDASLAPVPDLAAELCEVSDDEITWTCRLTSASFHNGEPVTAEDVAFTYRLAMSPRCTFREDLCLSGIVRDAAAVDGSTVVFTLTRPYAPFATLILPEMAIESRVVVEGAFALLANHAARLDLEGIAELSDRLQSLFSSPMPNASACARQVAVAEEVLAGTPGLRLPDRDEFLIGGENADEFDPCEYGRALVPRLSALVAAGEPSLDAVAASYALLDLGTHPVGTGPWRCLPGCLRPNESLTLTAFDGYVHGPPATATIEMVVIGDENARIEALIGGEVDWVRDIRDAGSANRLVDIPGVKLVTYNDLGFFSLQYNVRDGQLFADLGARKAVQHCIDKAAIVEAATNGSGVPIDGPIHPRSWAASGRLPPVQRDTRVAMDHLRDAGWMVEDADDDGIADGIATRGEESFRAEVVVREVPERIIFLERLRDQVADCGIQLEIINPHITLVEMFTFPHVLPNADGPFDVYFGGWSTNSEPDPFLLFHSSQCTTAEEPQLFNYICFRNEDVDALIEEGRRNSDPEERAAVYRNLERLLHEQQPYIFAWSDLARDAVDARLVSTAAALDMASPRWYWQLETLIVAEQ